MIVTGQDVPDLAQQLLGFILPGVFFTPILFKEKLSAWSMQRMSSFCMRASHTHT